MTAWENLGFHDEDSTDVPTPPTNSLFQENIAIPISLQRMALALDSILTQCSSEHTPEIDALRAKLSSGSTADFRDLDPLELSNLASYLAILATELARKATASVAHEVGVPEDF